MYLALCMVHSMCSINISYYYSYKVINRARYIIFRPQGKVKMSGPLFKKQGKILLKVLKYKAFLLFPALSFLTGCDVVLVFN